MKTTTKNLLIAAAAGIMLAGCSVPSLRDGDIAKTAPVSPVQPVAPAEETDDPVLVKTVLTKDDFDVRLKVVSKQCYGDIGCNVVVRVRLAGSENARGLASDVTVTITGDDGGPVTETISVDEEGKYDMPEVMLSTPRSSTKIKAKVTEVETY